MAITLQSKTELKGESHRTKAGRLWMLLYTFTSLAGDTEIARDVDADLDFEFLSFAHYSALALNHAQATSVAVSGSTVTYTKAGTGGTAGSFMVIVQTK